MLYLYIFLGTLVSSLTADCDLSLSGLGFFPPFVFSKDGNLLSTNDKRHSSITIPANNEVILSCSPNYFDKESSSKTKTVKCVHSTLGVADNILKGCKSTAAREILQTIPGCRGNATSVEFGYENPVKQESVVIGEACYDEKEGRTIFVHTKVINNGNSKIAALKTERANYFLSEAHPDYWYKAKFFAAASVDSLNNRLKELLPNETVPTLSYRSLLNLSMFQNIQLDSALETGWNLAISNGENELSNYDLLLKDIMSLNVSSFDIYLGTNSIFSVPTESKGAVLIHLLPDAQMFPVPKYLWAVVKTESGKGAGFLISNEIDATVEELTVSQPCESECAQMTWLTNLLNENAYKKPKRGFVTCCDLSNFKNKVSELPSIEGEYDLLIN